MRHVRCAIFTDQFFQVAMVGGDQGYISGSACSFHHFAQMGVHHRGAFDLGFTVGGMPDDIPVGKIGNDQIKSGINASMTFSVTSGNFNSGTWSKGMPLGDGMRTPSSPG